MISGHPFANKKQLRWIVSMFNINCHTFFHSKTSKVSNDATIQLILFVFYFDFHFRYAKYRCQFKYIEPIESTSKGS